MSLRVAGTDPGTSSLDVLILEDGTIVDQHRFLPADLKGHPERVVHWLNERGPFALVAGPSGYGLPLVRGADCTEREIGLITLVRPEDRGRGQGVLGFTGLVRALCRSSLPVIFLPGVIHLPTVPAHRKFNRIDLGTADKVCVAALAVALENRPFDGCLVEIGSAFTACLVIEGGRIVDGLGGTSGPVGWRSGGSWDGEAAYLLGPLTKADLFAGGAAEPADREQALAWFRESLVRAVAGLQGVHGFRQIVLSGRLLETEPIVAEAVQADLARFADVRRLASLPGAWVKHAAQGAAVIADGLADGTYREIVNRLELKQARGSVLDGLLYPQRDDGKARFAGG